MDDGHAYATLARGASHRGDGPPVSRTFQIVSDPRGRTSVGGAALCGAQCSARESCPACGGLAMVQPLAPRPRRRGSPRRGTGALAGRLASAGPVRGDGGGVGGAAAFRSARHTVWRGGMARAHGEASGPGVHATCSWSTAKISPRAYLRLPTPLSPQAGGWQSSKYSMVALVRAFIGCLNRHLMLVSLPSHEAGEPDWVAEPIKIRVDAQPPTPKK